MRAPGAGALSSPVLRSPTAMTALPRILFPHLPMPGRSILMPNALSASQVPNQFVECNGRRLAYRVIGDGTPMVLCLRFRGVMDSWDPAFLDELAELGFKVHVF